MGSRGDDGHDALLRTFMEFDLDAAVGDFGRNPYWDLRAAATFLTDRMATFAVREEQALRPGSPARDATELEHALLREEVGRFVREIEALRGATPAASANVRRRLLRSVHRIEMMLAVHCEGTLDRAGSAAVGTSPSVRRGTHSSGSPMVNEANAVASC